MSPTVGWNDTQRLREACQEYGARPRPEALEPLLELYRGAMAGAELGVRLDLCDQLARKVRTRRGSGHAALRPFLLADEHADVVANAALALATLTPRMDDDPLTGPKILLADLLIGPASEARAGAIVGGLLLLGDRRIARLLEAAWRLLGREGRLRAAGIFAGSLSAAHVEFLLDRLEEEPDKGLRGAIAGALAGMPMRAQLPLVIDAERDLPIYEEEPDALRVLGRWSIAEYGAGVRARVERMPVGDDPPALLGQVVAAWA